MVHIIISRPGKQSTTTFKFKSVEQGSAHMMKYNLSHRVIDVIEYK